MENKNCETGRFKSIPQKNEDINKKTSSNNNEELERESLPISILNIVLNTIMSIFLLFLTYKVYGNYDKKWKIFLYLTFWSLFMNVFYIVNITVLDYICLIKYSFYCKRCIRYNDFIRNTYLRITFPFSISIVFLYWMLILLGDRFQYASRSLWDNCISFCFHGLIFVFLLYDTCSYPHINRINKLLDLGVITIICFVYFIVIGVGKYAIKYDTYDFMSMSNIRQIAAAAILIYIAILDGYVVLILISNRFFIKEKVKEEVKVDKKELKEKQLTEKVQICSSNEKNPIKEENKNINENSNNSNVIIELIACRSNRCKLKPLNLKKKKEKKEEQSVEIK